MRLLVNAGDRAFILVRIPGYIRATSMQEYKNLVNNQKVKRKQQQTLVASGGSSNQALNIGVVLVAHRKGGAGVPDPEPADFEITSQSGWIQENNHSKARDHR
jgi:hypothetical protein